MHTFVAAALVSICYVLGLAGSFMFKSYFWPFPLFCDIYENVQKEMYVNSRVVQVDHDAFLQV